MICIPPKAVQSDTEIVVSFYRVVDSFGLDSTEFLTGIIEITPHELLFAKPIELLFRHHLRIMSDNSSTVTILYGGNVADENYSLCVN